MIRIPIIILCTFLYLAEYSTAPPNDSNSVIEDVQDEYYTVAKTDTDEFQPSDERDAEAILYSNRDPKTVYGILLYREKIRRNAISKIIWEKNLEIVDRIKYRSEQRVRRRWWFSQDYIRPFDEIIMDFAFSLIYDDNVVLAEYLYNFFQKESEPEKWITIAMVLTKDMNGLIATFDSLQSVDRIDHRFTFKEGRNDQRKPFKNLLRVWVRNNREPLEKGELLPAVIQQHAEALKKDQDDDGFKEKRDQLELILMYKSIKFARAVILAFEKLNGDKPIEEILNDNFKNCGLNENLANAYDSLVRYIKDKYKYIAEMLGKFSVSSDRLTVWIICIGVVQPQEWPKINEAFKKEHKGDSLSKFILENNPQDKTLAEAIALAVDSTFKPTTFKEIPIDNSPQTPSPEKP